METKDLISKTDLIYSSKMGATRDLDKDNTISATIEELREEEYQEYLVAEEHFKVQFLEGFKKDRSGQVKRVQAFMMPSFTLKNKQVEVVSYVSTSSSDLFSQLASLMDLKIADSHESTSDLLINLTNEINILKKENQEMVVILLKP